MMPTAGEQVWDDVDTDDNGVVGTGNANTFGYEVLLVVSLLQLQWVEKHKEQTLH